MYRCFGDFSGQHLAEATRQRQGEIAIATIQFEQIAFILTRSFHGPSKHFFAHPRIRLGKATFDLAVAVSAACNL